MHDLLIKGGRVVDPANSTDRIADIAISEGKVAEIGEDLSPSCARETLDAAGKLVVPGIIDMHTHMRTQLGHPHAQRMVARAGVCTAIDLAGPLDNILDSIPGSGAGINIGILEAARAGHSISCARPDAAERRGLIEKTLEHGGMGIKLLGGHFPMDLDICSAFVAEANSLGAWVAWHVGNTVHGSNILGMEDAAAAADGKFLHIAHVNSYCRGQVRDDVSEALEAIDILKKNPNLFSESYLSPLNGTRLTITGEGRPSSEVTATCLKKVGCTPDREGMVRAIREGRVGVLCDSGLVGELIYGEKAFEYWESKKTVTTGSFPVNPARSRFLVAQAKREDGSFAVDCFSTDGGTYPRNVIVENGLLLVQFGAITMAEFVVKSSLNAARALGLPGKGHLGIGADGDVSVLDFERKKAFATVAGGKVIMKDGALLGRGTTIICDARGEAWLKSCGIACRVKGSLDPEGIQRRFVPAC